VTPSAAAFAVIFIALHAGHQAGDHWVQTSRQAEDKSLPGRPGRLACAGHVASLTLAKAVFVTAAVLVTGIRPVPVLLAAALLLDAASHYQADRRVTLAALARLLGKEEFWLLGAPRPGRDDNPSLGTGAYALDQSWHACWLFTAALIASIGAG
jgi:hypothetical protein